MLRDLKKFFRLNQDSLATRILALQLAWAIVVYALFIAALWFATNLAIESNVKHQGETWIAKLDELGIPVYASHDPNQLSEAISYVRNTPEILSARYLDISGKKLVASYTRKNAKLSEFAVLDENAIKKLQQNDTGKKEILFEKGTNYQMRVSAPIWIKSIQNDGLIDFSLKDKSGEKAEVIGFIDIVLDYSLMSSEFRRNLIIASLLIALFMIAAAYIGRRIVHWALRPLSDLEEPLTRLADGDTNVTVKTSGDREIAKIGHALNTTINAIRERDEILQRMANHDSLTGLVNRKYFVEQLELEIGRIGANNGCSALFFFDLDRFKYINDTYGHAAGDRLLVQIAKLLTQRARGKDLVGRIGGDEFTLLAYNVSKEASLELADAFIHLMREFSFYEAGDMLKIHFSIGISLINDGNLSSLDYLKEADSAVHEAKSQGRNGYKLFKRNSSNKQHDFNTGWHERLQDVLINYQAIPYFQPLVGLKQQSEKISEVYLRIPDTGQSVLSAGAFLPAAERFGLMSEFDRQIIRKVAEVLAVQKDSSLVFSINLSEQFIENKDSADFLKKLISEYHVSPKHFIFEIAEQHIIRNLDRLSKIIPELSALDFRFAIDDFGLSFSSFSYIKQIPVHFLKINGSLIENLHQEKFNQVSVRSIVEVAGMMNMQTIAKFVTDQESISILNNLGVDFAQGNFIRTASSAFELAA